MSFKDKLAFFKHLISDNSSQEDTQKNTQPKQGNEKNDNIQIQQQHEEYRNSQNKHKLDVLQFNITLTNILNGKDNLLKIRSILIIFVFKDLIDISPYFPTLLTEDILLSEPKEELFSKDHKYFNPIFYNELKKHPLLMLNVIEVIKEFIQIHSLQFESIYPLIANIIRANEDSTHPLRLNQMNFFNESEVNDKYKNQIIQNYPLILPFKFKYQEYINKKSFNKHLFVCANRKNILDAVWSLVSFKEKQFTLEVVFDDEPGVDSDHGGISREFIQLAFENIIEKETDLFELRNGYYWFKYHKDPSDDLLKKFKCVGILLATSILNGFNIPIRFPRYFYRKILNRNFVISDLAFFDPDLLKTVEYVQNNKISNTDNFEYIYYDQIDHYKVDLSNFRDVTGNESFKPKLITNDNKQSFVVKVNEWAFNTSVKHTFKAFQQGFQKVQLN